MQIDSDEFTTSVIVKRSSREDAGVYQLVAKNQWGTAEASFNVAVQGESSNKNSQERRCFPSGSS